MKIDINNPKYPWQLKKIDNPPKQLYLKGNIFFQYNKITAKIAPSCITTSNIL